MRLPTLQDTPPNDKASAAECDVESLAAGLVLLAPVVAPVTSVIAVVDVPAPEPEAVAVRREVELL